MLFLGYDESNNGSVPEVHVIAMSTEARHREKRRSIRKGFRMHETLDRVLRKCHDFRFMVLGEDELQQINGSGQGYKTFASLYSLLDGIDFEYDLVVDGKAPRRVADTLVTLGMGWPHFRIAADKKYPVVNFADRIAYKLAKDAMNGNHLITEHNDKRIYLDVAKTKQLYFGIQGLE